MEVNVWRNRWRISKTEVCQCYRQLIMTKKINDNRKNWSIAVIFLDDDELLVVCLKFLTNCMTTMQNPMVSVFVAQIVYLYNTEYLTGIWGIEGNPLSMQYVHSTSSPGVYAAVEEFPPLFEKLSQTEFTESSCVRFDIIYCISF